VSTEPTKTKPPSENKSTAAFGTKAVAFIAVTAIVAWGVSFGLMPLLQGQQQGLDWFTSLCRAVGISGQGDKAGQLVGGVSLVTWSPSVLGRLARADTKRGEEIAVDTCSSCHFPNGDSADPATIPSISGQPAHALYKQLWDIKNGTRINEPMKPLVDELDDAQIADVATYYSQRAARNRGFRFEPESSASVLKLVTQGDAARALPACRACHDAVAGGPIEAPNLIGQHPGYTAAQLSNFATAERRNDLFARMRTIAAKLTPDERSALAKYYDGPR
jgi:cytochrome c553